MCGHRPNIDSDDVVDRLRSAGVLCADAFEKELTQNAGDGSVMRDLR